MQPDKGLYNTSIYTQVFVAFLADIVSVYLLYSLLDTSLINKTVTLVLEVAIIGCTIGLVFTLPDETADKSVDSLSEIFFFFLLGITTFILFIFVLDYVLTTYFENTEVCGTIFKTKGCDDLPDPEPW